MQSRDLVDLILLATLWSGSFLLMRVAVPEFGPFALIAVRVAVAAVFLFAVLAWRGGLSSVRRHAVELTVVGLINSALPFCLFAYAVLSLESGFAAILNATAPMWGAIVAWAWLHERPTRWRVAGLVVGFIGIVVLSWDRVSFKEGGTGLALVAGLLASVSYGVAASYTRRTLNGVEPLVVATGSQLGATILLAPFAVGFWPAGPVSAKAWISTVIVGVASTGIAYILYFRLIANVGPARAIAVTFLVPVFAVLWGSILLDEAVTVRMLVGGLVVLLGTALSTGLLRPPTLSMRRADP